MKVIPNEILEVAFYISHWNYNGLGITQSRVLEIVSSKTDLKTFNKLLEEFRDIATGSRESKSKYPKNIIKTHDYLVNKTVTQIRKIIINNLNKN